MKRHEILIILGLVLADQLTKIWAKATLYTQTIEVIPSFLRFMYVENDGAAWSILSGRMWFFYIITVVYLIFFVRYLYNKETKHSFLRLSIVIIIAGTIGNFIDRLRLNYVIDFISVNIFGYDFPVFNIADMSIVIGAIGLITYTLLIEGKKEVA